MGEQAGHGGGGGGGGRIEDDSVTGTLHGFLAQVSGLSAPQATVMGERDVKGLRHHTEVPDSGLGDSPAPAQAIAQGGHVLKQLLAIRAGSGPPWPRQHTAREAGEAAAAEEPPYMATQLAQEAQQEAAEHFEAEAQKQAEAQMQAVAQAEHTLRMQAEAVAQAQALAEVQAQALADAAAQAQAVAEIQRQYQVQAQEAQDIQEAQEAAAAERHALRAQGFNSKRLPLRPGVPPCTFFLRKGECKYGKNCKWDHPETALNSKGLPLRPGELPCAFYLRSGTCKFNNTCKFDHPEPNKDTGMVDVQAHLEALTQAMVPQVAEINKGAALFDMQALLTQAAEFNTTGTAVLDMQTGLAQLAAEAKLAEIDADAAAAASAVEGKENQQQQP